MSFWTWLKELFGIRPKVPVLGHYTSEDEESVSPYQYKTVQVIEKKKDNSMRVTLTEEELDKAVVEYLRRRGFKLADDVKPCWDENDCEPSVEILGTFAPTPPDIRF